jgi:diguanylate cyclase (GGDEF)-like protein
VSEIRESSDEPGEQAGRRALRPLGHVLTRLRPPPDHLVVGVDDVQHAADVELANARAARADAVWLVRQAAALCVVAVQTHDLGTRALAAAARHSADATVDELTGALRRNGGFVALAGEIDRSRRDGASLVLGFLDVDGLKAVNDTDGHAAGDALLVAVVDALRASLRSYDVVVRYGGDEFLFSLSGADEEAAAQRLKTMRTLLGHRMSGRSVSAGFATLRPDDDLDALIRRADLDLYTRRSAERGR